MSTIENKAFVHRYLDAISGKEKPAALVNEYIAASDETLKQHIMGGEVGFPRYALIADELCLRRL